MCLIKTSSTPHFYTTTKTFSDSVVFHKDRENISSYSPLSNWEKTILKQSNSNIFFLELESNLKLSLGYKRNLSINLSNGEYICIWDDDDIYHNDRLKNQFSFLKFRRKPACSLSSLIIHDERNQKRYLSIERGGGWEGTVLCKKDEMGSFASLNRKEDTPVLDFLKRTDKLAVMEDPELYNYCIHSGNVSGENHFSTLINNSEILF